MGVPVRPNRNAFGSAWRILRPRLPSWVRWASSTMTMMFERSLSLPPASPNLWMVVISTWVHYIILTSRPLEDPTVVGWQETILSHPTCGGVPDGHGSRDLL